MDKRDCEKFAIEYGERWILRDVDLFPEKLSSAAADRDYSKNLYMNIINGKGISFETEMDAVTASIRIYKLLGKEIPVDLMMKYFEYFK
jgi:hypothetical protein